MLKDIQDKRERMAEICARRGVKRLRLFGSANGESFDPSTSDLDFLVAFEPLGLGTSADAFFGLKEDLEALFGRQVDLVMESAIRNRYFKKSADSSAILLYAA
ncbi:MAG: nucleotidyltransferase domain-containing protein [Candidatus Omnitrophica bacterium]|nr:hypothetical protein [bacterium]NUN97790.1 nucleotidyltransferase domain-containing protein [Candidatus Omnitrophota bacterium]